MCIYIFICTYIYKKYRIQVFNESLKTDTTTFKFNMT